MGCRAGELHGLVLTAVCLDITKDTQDDILGHDSVFEMAVQDNFDCRRHFEPEFTGDESRSHFCSADTGTEVPGPTVGSGMGVSCGRNLTGFGIPCFMHDGMADAFADVQLLHPVAFCNFKTCIIMSGVIFGDSRGHAVVKDNGDFVRIVNFRRAHLLQRIQKIRGINIMDHEHIRLCDDDISGLHMLFPRVALQ